MRVVRAVCIGLALVALAAAPVQASGFSIYEQGAKASGQAGAWVARADDAAANWYNPAAMVRQKGMQVQFGINYISIGIDTQLEANDPLWGVPTPTTFDSETNGVFPPHLYFTQSINDRWAWGLGITTPFGLVTEWTDIPVTLSSKKADLATLVANANVAYAFNDQWSIAVGVDYMFADIREFRRVIDQSPVIAQPPLTALGEVNLTGDGDALGFNVATHYRSERWAFGLTYRGELSPEIDGDVEFTNSPLLPAPALALFPSGPAAATIDLPAEAAVGLAFTGVKDWQFEADLAWAGWSSFERLQVDFENNTPAVGDLDLREDWEDTMSYRLGASWNLAAAHQIRFGVLYDENPVPDDTLRPSIPDGDRWSPTLGYGFAGTKWNIDAYYMALFFNERDASGTANRATPGHPDSGVINGTYSSFVHLAGVTLSYRF